MRTIHLVLLSCLLSFAAARLIRLQIDPYFIDCMGIIPTKCLQVRENSNNDFITFKGQIRWFNFTEGIRYFIIADKAMIPNQIRGLTNINYALLRKVVRYWDEAPQLPSNLNYSTWKRVYVQQQAQIITMDNVTQANKLMQPSTEFVGHWFLATAGGYNLTKPPKVTVVDSIINFDYCNNITLNFQREGDRVNITSGFSTLRQCTGTPSEAVLNNSFRECVKLTFNEFTLTCLNKNGQPVLTLLR